jgi:hypothetical protein
MEFDFTKFVERLEEEEARKESVREVVEDDTPNRRRQKNNRDLRHENVRWNRGGSDGQG